MTSVRLNLHFSLRSVLGAGDVKLGKRDAVAVHFVNDEHLMDRSEDISADLPPLWTRRLCGITPAYLSYTHLVGGEGASLVGADDGSAAQSLHGGQTPDDGVFLGHATGSQSQAGGDDSGQACSRWARGLGREPQMKNTAHAKTVSGIRTNIRCSAVIAVGSVMISTISMTVLTFLSGMALKGYKMGLKSESRPLSFT